MLVALTMLARTVQLCDMLLAVQVISGARRSDTGDLFNVDQCFQSACYLLGLENEM